MNFVWCVLLFFLYAYKFGNSLILKWFISVPHTEVKKAARENSPNLREMLTSIRLQDLVPSCFKEAILEASRGGHMDAICSLVITGGRHSLQLRDCISEALKFHACDAAAMLLTCYAAKHDKKKLLKYLMSVEVDKENEREALAELPNDAVLTHDVLSRMRYLLVNEDCDFHSEFLQKCSMHWSRSLFL